MKTFSPKPDDITKEWWVLDAAGRTIGHVAVDAARLIRGKHKTIYAPHADTGDFVVIINAAQVELTGKKKQQKEWIRHSGFPGGLKRTNYEVLLATRPSKAVEMAVKGMLPKNRLGKKLGGKVFVYDGAEHPHAAQTPKAYVVPEGDR